MEQFFTGQYYKHQKDDRTLSLIVGRTGAERFIQVITDEESFRVPFQNGNSFSDHGIRLQIGTSRLALCGTIRYHALSPVTYDIMGPFRYFPMECSHGIVSMRHRLSGSVVLNGEELDFTGGLGYMETDSGYSFPSEYTWIQANDFQEPCSVMAAVAKIPFAGFTFKGCICIIQYGGREYRLATYLGVRVLVCTPKRIVLKQGVYLLDIRIGKCNFHPLTAPQEGKMVRTIREAVSCPAEFHFTSKGKTVFRFVSKHASFESEGM